MAIDSLQGFSTAAAYSAASAMNAFGQGMNAVAHNVANINTAGFEAQRVDYMSGPQDQGVQVGAISSPGNFASEILPERPDTVPASFGASQFLPPEALDPSNTEIAREFTTMIATQRAYEANATTIGTWDSMLGTVIDLKA